nr:unnamed protein product [Haemonchus contortus]
MGQLHVGCGAISTGIEGRYCRSKAGLFFCLQGRVGLLKQFSCKAIQTGIEGRCRPQRDRPISRPDSSAGSSQQPPILLIGDPIGDKG